MTYKVLITASGVGQRLGDLTKYTNKALVRVGRKPVISYIIEAYPKNIPLVITTGYYSKHVKDFVKLAYPERPIQFVEVDNYDGPGSSLGYSMLKAEKHLNCPFIFHAADTLVVDEKIPAPSRNWIGAYKGSDASQYRSWNVLETGQYALNDKGAIEFDYIHIGLVGVKEHKSFWDHLKALYKKYPNEQSLNDCQVIESLLNNDHRFDMTAFTKWYDVGNTKSLEETRKIIPDHFDNLHKADEAIFMVNGRVVKFFHNPTVVADRVKRQKLLKQLVPEKLGHAENFYSYKFEAGELYSRAVTPFDFKNFLTWTEKNLWKEKNVVPSAKFKKICRDFYETKTKERIAQFLKSNNLKDEPHEINDEKIPTLKEMLEMIDFAWLSEAKQHQFHGDFILDNILKIKGGYRLLDWRQHFGGLHEAGDMYYDLAKLNHNLTVNHDIVHQNLMGIKFNNKKVRVDINRSENLVQCQKILMDFIKERGYNLQKVETLTAIIWLNMAPLHHYPFNIFLYYFGKLNLWRVIKKYPKSKI